jgi:hypothetical protein
MVLIAKTVILISTGVDLDLQDDESHGFVLIMYKFFNSGALAFDAEHSRWLEEKNKQMNELRSALNAHAGDSELRIIVDGVMAHYEELFRIKSNAAKNDVFHLLSGMWKTPAERCFLWLGGFRSSELLKVRSNFTLSSPIASVST